ncbi:MAG: virulence factor SrfB [Muribaculaceae bacterium]|nr:virulence factor SrfB [Muribaculaceae bacterium]
MEYTLIANSGIQLFTFRLKINTQDRFKQWFHEWYDSESGEWKLELVHQISTDFGTFFFKKADLLKKGYLSNPNIEIDINDLKMDEIFPLKVDDQLCPGVKGEIYSLTMSDRDNKLSAYENEWLPAPYFFKRTERRFKFGPLNWSRFKLIPVKEEKGEKIYDVLLAFDTQTTYEDEVNNENPVFPDKFRKDIDLALCSNEVYLLDYCSGGMEWSYVEERLMHLAHPGITRISQLRGANIKRMSYAASYIFLISFLAQNSLFPSVKLYKDIDVEVRDVDMVVDIGNSRTTALLIEDNSNFNQVRPLSLIDFTDMLTEAKEGMAIHTYDEPFDMRLAFRKVNFGDFGPLDSRQFVYPSLVRLGQEANTLIHRATNMDDRVDSLSTYSSPKRYLWDWRPNKEEWQFLVLPGEKDDHIINLRGITSQLKSDGQLDADNNGGVSFHYSRRSLMTLSFLEMLVQAHTQINSFKHRSVREGFGSPDIPRKVKRIIVTCPTAMSKLEREALIKCARDSVRILERFNGRGDSGHNHVEVIPSVRTRKDADPEWYYDEATCSQLVYMYGEVGHKYKGCCSEFFNLYGKIEEGDTQHSLTVGSLDIGAGTSDLMISKYTYEKGDITTITPDPLFYDSFYFAGDDMLNGMVKNIMLLNEESAFRLALPALSSAQYRQLIKDFFGPDHNGQTVADRILRKDFNIQYSVPLMCHFLELLKNNHKDCTVSYEDVFAECPPNPAIISGFLEKTGIDITRLEWKFNKEAVSAVVEKEFEPLLKKVATMMYSYACDIVLLSGRPASLPVIREIFLRYYAVFSPDRLIVLNNYNVGDWYPFDNNTGYITNPKTIVAMGGVIGHYASELSNLNKFVINLDKLKEGLKSTVNYIEATREGQPIEYFITPEQSNGDLTVSRIPAYLNVRQIGMDTYPCRTLYSIDFNVYKIADKIRRDALMNDEMTLTDAKVQALVHEQVDKLKKRMPFKLTIERDADDSESLIISSIRDRDDNDVHDGNVEINIQSLGVNEKYWLDSGEFNF